MTRYKRPNQNREIPARIAVQLLQGGKPCIAGALLLVMSACAPDKGDAGNGNATTEAASSSSSGPSEQELAALIAPDAISSYSASDRKTYPKLFASIGKRISEVGPMGKQAALLALRTKQCDRVIYVDVSERSTLNDLQFFVDCENETRVRVTEAEIKAGLAQDVETKDARMARANANVAEYDALVSKAKDRVRASLRDPGSAEFGPVTISHKNGTVACGTVSSKNGFGGMSGQQPFIAFTDSVMLPENERDFAAQWKKYCG